MKFLISMVPFTTYHKWIWISFKYFQLINSQTRLRSLCLHSWIFSSFFMKSISVVWTFTLLWSNIETQYPKICVFNGIIKSNYRLPNTRFDSLFNIRQTISGCPNGHCSGINKKLLMRFRNSGSYSNNNDMSPSGKTFITKPDDERADKMEWQIRRFGIPIGLLKSGTRAMAMHCYECWHNVHNSIHLNQ